MITVVSCRACSKQRFLEIPKAFTYVRLGWESSDKSNRDRADAARSCCTLTSLFVKRGLKGDSLARTPSTKRFDLFDASFRTRMCARSWDMVLGRFLPTGRKHSNQEKHKEVDGAEKRCRHAEPSSEHPVTVWFARKQIIEKTRFAHKRLQLHSCLSTRCHGAQNEKQQNDQGHIARKRCASAAICCPFAVNLQSISNQFAITFCQFAQNRVSETICFPERRATEICPKFLFYNIKRV